MKQPKALFLLVGFIVLMLYAAAADAKSQLASPQATQGGTPLPIAQTLLEARHWGGWVNALVVDGSYAYLNVGREVQVYSLTDPAVPTLVGSLLLDDVPSHLAVSGNYLYVGHAHSAQLKIIDISDPTAPVWLGSLNLPTEPQGALWWRELTSSGNNALFTASIWGPCYCD
jgi:hypothetical protein